MNTVIIYPLLILLASLSVFSSGCRNESAEERTTPQTISEETADVRPLPTEKEGEFLFARGDVVFGPNRGMMTVKYKGRTIQSLQVGQATALQRNPDGAPQEIQNERAVKSIVGSLWAGLPFAPGMTINGTTMPLAPIDLEFGIFEFTNERIIRIIDADNEGYALLPSDRSVIPVWMDSSSGRLEPTPLVRASGITWEFEREGIAFRTLLTNYVTTKKGATVRFTKSGVLFDGIEVEEKDRE